MELRAALPYRERHRRPEHYGRPSAPTRLRAWSSSRRLDERLAAGEDPATDRLLGYRADKLAAPKFRRELALGLRGVVARAARPVALSAAAPAGPGVRFEQAHLEELADRVEVEGPIGVRGVAQAWLLLTDGSSALWAGGKAELADAIEASIIGLRV